MRIFLLSLFIFIAACSPSTTPTYTQVQPTTEKKLGSPLTTVLDKTIVELGDTKAELLLSTSASSDKGNIHWDDSQHWRLTLRVDGLSFVLFDGFLGIAKLDYWVSLLDDQLVVMTLTSGSAQFTLSRFEYSAEKQILKKTEPFNVDENWNLMHQSHYH